LEEGVKERLRGDVVRKGDFLKAWNYEGQLPPSRQTSSKHGGLGIGKHGPPHV